MGGRTARWMVVLRGALNPGFVTGSLDGKPVAPLLPNRTEWTHQSQDFSYGCSTAYWQGYDDYVVSARFTPRNEMRIDCEICWLVHPDAVEGKDFRDREPGKHSGNRPSKKTSCFARTNIWVSCQAATSQASTSHAKATWPQLPNGT